jgi:hypothetical protein
MSGIEIVVGVIIGVLFELLSNTEGTPSEQGTASNLGTVEKPFKTVETVSRNSETPSRAAFTHHQYSEPQATY